MGDMGEYWNDLKPDMKADSMKRRADNRENSARLLTEAGLTFTTSNGGVHLVVTGGGETVDFWPGTGLWKVRRSGLQSRGVARLIKTLIGDQEPRHD